MKPRIEDQSTPRGIVLWRPNGDFHEKAVARGGRQLERLFALNPVAVGKDE